MNRRILLLAALVAGLGAAVLAALRFLDDRPSHLLAQLARAQPERTVAPRLSITTEYRPCTVDDPPDGHTVPIHVCASPADVPRLLDRLAAAGESADSDSLRASALSKVIWWGDKSEASQDTAIERLQTALRLAANPVPVLVDLSAAFLVRAERTQNARDLFAAADQAREALRLDPKNVSALYNYALALELEGVDQQAIEAWDAYLEADDDSPWADDARRRLNALRAVAPAGAAPGTGASAAEVNAFAARHPQQARLHGWDSVLGEWGAAVLEGRTARADSLLRLAEGLGNALVRREGGDGSLADAVQAIRAIRNDAGATRVLARAHRAYASTQSEFLVDEAGDSLSLVIELNPPSPMLVAWARASYGRGLAYKRRYDEAATLFLALQEETDSLRYPALAARLNWMLGTVRMKTLRYHEASRLYRSAAGTFKRIGELEHFGATRGMEGEAAYDRGDTLNAYRFMHEALRALSSARTSSWRHDLLFTLAELVSKDAMPLGAVPIQEENLWVALRQDDPKFGLEALLGQAAVLVAAGDTAGARRNLHAAARIVDTLPESEVLTGLAQRLSYVETVVAAESATPAALDSAIEYFAIHNRTWLAQARLVRANHRRASRDVAGLVEDLEGVTQHIRGLSDEEARAELRASMLSQVQEHFDRLVMLHVGDGDTLEALRVLERGRVSFGRDTGIDVQPRLSAPPGEVAVEYALIGDTLLAWTLRGTDVRLDRRIVRRDSLRRVIDQLGALLESRRGGQAAPHLRRLYDWLVHPVHGRLGPAGTPVVIVADGEIAGVPFAALLDARQRYLVEDHSLRTASSLADAARPAPPAPAGPAAPALLVADPKFDLLAHPTLRWLKGARAEMAALQPLYPDAMVLGDSGATRQAFVTRAPRAGVIHYAGHAVFDDSRPTRSYLLLAGQDTTGRLSADAVASLDLAGVRLVVLSACRTLPARHGRAGGFTGLSGALLSAGAGGVVGSLWEVDDQLTQPLMVEFHRAYLDSRNAAEALREAQRSMLRSSDPARRSPSAWAGFRYAGW